MIVEILSGFHNVSIGLSAFLCFGSSPLSAFIPEILIGILGINFMRQVSYFETQIFIFSLKVFKCE